MMRILTMLLSLGVLASCDIITGIYQGVQGNRQETVSDEPSGQLTRAMVEASDVALIGVKAGHQEADWTYFLAQAGNNDVASFGKHGRLVLTLRGGMVNSQYVLGNDLMAVEPDFKDPIQFQKPLDLWPSEITRIYELPGEGMKGDRRHLTCQYTKLDPTTITIVEKPHKVTKVKERCIGDKLEFENLYMVAPSGFIWKSEQWAGKNPVPLLIEIIEPLD